MAANRNDMPDNLEIRRLETHLTELAAKWREAQGDTARQQIIVTSYHRAMARLYELGWDEMLSSDDELPEWLMPRDYLDRTTTHAGVPEGFYRKFQRVEIHNEMNAQPNESTGGWLNRVLDKVSGKK